LKPRTEAGGGPEGAGDGQKKAGKKNPSKRRPKKHEREPGPNPRACQKGKDKNRKRGGGGGGGVTRADPQRPQGLEEKSALRAAKPRSREAWGSREEAVKTCRKKGKEPEKKVLKLGGGKA